MNAFYFLLAIILLLVLYIIGIYNSLIAKRNQVNSIEAGVDTQLKRRYDLLPNLVAAAKQYLTHEKELFGPRGRAGAVPGAGEAGRRHRPPGRRDLRGIHRLSAGEALSGC